MAHSGIPERQDQYQGNRTRMVIRGVGPLTGKELSGSFRNEKNILCFCGDGRSKGIVYVKMSFRYAFYSELYSLGRLSPSSKSRNLQVTITMIHSMSKRTVRTLLLF